MRQLLICNGFGTRSEGTIELYNGVNIVNFGTSVRGELSLVLNRSNENGGPIHVPVYSKDFSWSKKVHTYGMKRSVMLGPATIPSSFDRDYHFSVILVVKGKQFNERNKYTVSHTIKKGSTGNNTSWASIAGVLATKLSNLNLPISASWNSGTGQIVARSEDNSFDFTLLGTDDLLGCSVSYQNISVARNTPEELQELISKAAADKGFNYTYKSASEYLYPALNGVPAKESRVYDLYTLRFAEPRMTKTRDEVVHQIVQVVVIGTDGDPDELRKFETWLKYMSHPVYTALSEDTADKAGAGDSQIDD